MIWTAIIATSFIAFMLKYLGQAVPAAWLENARIQKFALYLPTALLAALVAVQSLGSEKNINTHTHTHTHTQTQTQTHTHTHTHTHTCSCNAASWNAAAVGP